MPIYDWRSFFHWKFSGVFIVFFWSGAFVMLSFAPSVDSPTPLLILAYLFLLAGWVWSLGYWFTCEFLHKKNPKSWKPKKLKKATEWQKRVYYIWGYSITVLISCLFIASVFLSHWIGTGIEQKDTKTGKKFAEILDTLKILKNAPRPPEGTTVKKEPFKPPAFLKAQVKGAYGVSPFKIGEPIEMKIYWENTGYAPATMPVSFAKIYVEDNAQLSTQRKIIDSFKKEYAQILKHARKEYPALHPFDPNPSFINVRGEIFTEELAREFFKNNGNVLYVISAVRFKDAVGLHEAHTCQRTSIIEGIHENISAFKVTNIDWTYCREYVSPVDIK